jgi:hypothetical protein
VVRFHCECGGISGRGNPCGCLRSISCRIAVDPVRSVDTGVILPEGPRSRSGRIPFQSAGFSEKPQLGESSRGPRLEAWLTQERRLASSAVPHLQLVTTDGTVLGARELGRPDWPPGTVIYTGPNEPNLRVLEL